MDINELINQIIENLKECNDIELLYIIQGLLIEN